MILGLSVSLVAGELKKNNYWESNKEIKDAIAKRKGKTELSKLAASMKPGTWAELKHEMPKRIWNAPSPSKGLHIGTWSDDGHWDSLTGQFVYFGVRQTRKLIAYSEEKNQWRDIPFTGKPNAPEVVQKFGHQYSCNSLDPIRSVYYTYTWRYDIVKDTWSKLPSCSKKMGSKSNCWTYFTAMDGLFSIFQKPKGGTLNWYGAKEKAWKNVGRVGVHGYHSIARHNPIREEVIFAGGNGSRAVGILTKDGKFKQMKDFPLVVKKFTINGCTITIDPVSGRYLFMVTGSKFVEFDADKNEYRLIDDFTKTPWPFYKYDGTVTAFIPEYGVSMWADKKKVHLYKHKLCTGKPLEFESNPAPDKSKVKKK